MSRSKPATEARFPHPLTLSGTDLDPRAHGPFDVLVVGSGVAGLSAAVRAATRHGLSVAVLTKGNLDAGSTRWAQGGVAAVLEEDPDSTDLHLSDTLAAGGELCDVDAVRVLVDEGPARVRDLMALGAEFDRDPEGRIELAREGGHSMARIVHAGGSATGAEVERTLDAATRTAIVDLFERWFAYELIVEAGRCTGVRALRPDGVPVEIRAANVLVATGGAGQLFAVTTNPVESTGDGVAMALRAGVAVADVEFMQFHPTALHTPEMPRPLLTEALRGHGALLRGHDGERFVDELLPRDIVSRAEAAVMIGQGIDHVWLDATDLDHFGERFPNIAAELVRVGLDPEKDWLPVAPAAHYLSGGLLTDLVGATSLPGLWAAGEAACTGVHGANRLASNSLLEGMVFGPRVIEAIAAGVDGPSPEGAMRAVLTGDSPVSIPGVVLEAADVGVPLATDHVATPPGPLADTRQPSRDGGGPAGGSDPTGIATLRATLQRDLTFHAGVLRSADSLARARASLDAVQRQIGEPTRPDQWELMNLCATGRALVRAATRRTESRGAHARIDHPDLDPNLHVRFVQR